jgi:putative ATPase
LEPLNQQQLEIIFDRALTDKENGYGNRNIVVEDKAREHLTHLAGGDARNLLNAIELAVETTLPDTEGSIHITLDVAQESIQKRALLYDRMGDEHYDTISALLNPSAVSDPSCIILAGKNDPGR